MSRRKCFSTTHLRHKPFILASCKFAPMLQIKSLLGNKNAEFNEWMSRNIKQLHTVWCSRRPGLRLKSDGIRSVSGVQYRLPLYYPVTEHTPRCTSHHKTLLLLILHQHVNQKVYQSAVAGFPLTSLPLLHLARLLSSSFCLCFYSLPLLRSPPPTIILSSSRLPDGGRIYFIPCSFLHVARDDVSWGTISFTIKHSGQMTKTGPLVFHHVWIHLNPLLNLLW